MQAAIAAAVITVLGTGFLSAVGAIVMGKLVPSSRADRAERDAEKWRAAYEEMRRAQDQQARLLDRLQMSAEITDHVMSALRNRIDTNAPGVALPTAGGERP